MLRSLRHILLSVLLSIMLFNKLLAATSSSRSGTVTPSVVGFFPKMLYKVKRGEDKSRGVERVQVGLIGVRWGQVGTMGIKLGYFGSNWVKLGQAGSTWAELGQVESDRPVAE